MARHALVHTSEVGDARSFPSRCHRLPEQRAIAAALSDVDALLGALDRLIAKKRDLKQAAMQQLLTGQTRLPASTASGRSKKLGELLQIEHWADSSSMSAKTSRRGIYPY